MDGKHLRTLRKAAGLTVEALAAKSGIKPRVIWSWERGERTPRVDKAQALAAALGVTMDKLMSAED